VGHGKGRISIWNVAERRRERVLEHGSGRINGLSFRHAPGGELASCGEDKEVCLWDAATGACLRRLTCDDSPVTAVAFGGDILLSGHANGKVWLTDLKENKSMLAPEQLRVPVAAVAGYEFGGGIIQPTGISLAAVGTDGAGLRLDHGNHPADRHLPAPRRVPV